MRLLQLAQFNRSCTSPKPYSRRPWRRIVSVDNPRPVLPCTGARRRNATLSGVATTPARPILLHLSGKLILGAIATLQLQYQPLVPVLSCIPLFRGQAIIQGKSPSDHPLPAIWRPKAGVISSRLADSRAAKRQGTRRFRTSSWLHPGIRPDILGGLMDETDRLKTAATLETVRTGVPSTWRNPDTGNEYV